MFFEESLKLNLIEVFASVQGETSLTGFPTTFIRLAACNLRCSWCDTTYSFKKGESFSLNSIISQVKMNQCKHVCITGGEPLLQDNVYGLMSRLCDLGFSLSLETGGSLPINSVDSRVAVILDIKCPGSNMSHKNDYSNIYLLKPVDEVKFVIADRNDYEFAKSICAQYNLFDRKMSCLFSPVFEQLPAKTLVEWILQDKIPVRLNLQTHKFIWEPSTRGV